MTKRLEITLLFLPILIAAFSMVTSLETQPPFLSFHLVHSSDGLGSVRKMLMSHQKIRCHNGDGRTSRV